MPSVHVVRLLAERVHRGASSPIITMAPPKYLELVVHRKAQGGAPMIKQIIKLSGLDVNTMTKCELMHTRIKKLRPNFEYLDTEIVYVKTGGGSFVGSEMFDVPVDNLEEMIDSGEKWKLEVQIDSQATMGRTKGAESNVGFFQIQAHANAKEYLKGEQVQLRGSHDIPRKIRQQNGLKFGDLVRIYADGKSDAERGEEADPEEVPLLFCGEALICGPAIESQYYAPASDPQRGQRIVAKHL